MLQKWLVAVMFVILAYCGVELLFVVYQHGVAVGKSGWKVNVSVDSVGLAIARRA